MHKFCYLLQLLVAVLMFSGMNSSEVVAQPRAFIVVDADTYEVLSDKNADLRLHPAGLTKLMTLYAAFSEIQAGKIGLDDIITISSFAANEPPVELGLKAGMKIKFRHLLRAAGVQGANDAASAIGEAIAGSEVSFSNELNFHSQKLGLGESAWKNSHGLTQAGHFSTARDISLLMIQHKESFPEYFNLFGRRNVDAGLREVTSSSMRLLADIKGVEAARYGHTRAAGHNGVVYVSREDRNLVAVVFGASTTQNLIDDLNQMIDMSLEAEM